MNAILVYRISASTIPGVYFDFVAIVRNRHIPHIHKTKPISALERYARYAYRGCTNAQNSQGMIEWEMGHNRTLVG